MPTDMSSLESLLQTSIAGMTLQKLFTAVVAAVVSLIVIKILLGVTDRTLKRVSIDGTLKKLIRTALKALMLFVAILVVMGYLNIPVTSLVAVLSVVGLALSLALQNFLSNVAGGFQILATHPFKNGDFVEIGGCTGTVVETGLFYTKLNSIDNKLIQLPNSVITSANIVNYSSEEKRQVELKVSASYDSDPEKVRQLLARLVGEHPLTLATPEPMIHVFAYQDSAIQYIVRAWCANADYWTVYYDLMDSLKPAFDQAGIEMTYPHVNVHMMES